MGYVVKLSAKEKANLNHNLNPEFNPTQLRSMIKITIKIKNEAVGGYLAIRLFHMVEVA